jgi:hypothetical protein
MEKMEVNMKLVKTASGNKILKISSSEWRQIGLKAGWIKIARSYSVEYSPSMTSTEIIKKIIYVKPSLVPAGMSEREYVERLLKKQVGQKVFINKMIAIEDVSKKKGPSQKDLQRMRGEKLRKERDKKLKEKNFQEWMRQKRIEYNLPSDAPLSQIELFEQMEEFEDMEGANRMDRYLNKNDAIDSNEAEEEDLLEQLRKLKK